MFLRNRIKFFRPDGTRGDSPGCGSVLIAFGRENAEILRNCSLQGKYVELNNDKNLIFIHAHCRSSVDR